MTWSTAWHLHGEGSRRASCPTPGHHPLWLLEKGFERGRQGMGMWQHHHELGVDVLGSHCGPKPGFSGMSPRCPQHRGLHVVEMLGCVGMCWDILGGGGTNRSVGPSP